MYIHVLLFNSYIFLYLQLYIVYICNAEPATALLQIVSPNAQRLKMSPSRVSLPLKALRQTVVNTREHRPIMVRTASL